MLCNRSPHCSMWLHSATWHPYQTLNISSFLRTCLGMNRSAIHTDMHACRTHIPLSIIYHQIGHACILPGEGSGRLHFSGTTTGCLLSDGLSGTEHGYQLQVQFWRGRRQWKGLRLCFSRPALHATAIRSSASARAGHARCSTLLFNGASSSSAPALSVVLLSALV